VNPAVVGTQIGRLEVQPVSDLAKSIRRRRIAAACITVPTPAAQPVADVVVEAGVRGIWNFASTDLKVPPDVVLENQHLEHGLMTLSYRLKRQAEEKAGIALPDMPEDDA
jgi:redox-sensing transcriptional repressor